MAAGVSGKATGQPGLYYSPGSRRWANVGQKLKGGNSPAFAMSRAKTVIKIGRKRGNNQPLAAGQAQIAQRPGQAPGAGPF